MEFNNLLANIVSIFHTIVVLFELFAPFSDIPALLILHITFSVTLLSHWYGNSDVCSLSYLESFLRGKPYTEGFTYKFIGPMYNISQTEWSQLCYILTIGLMCISIYKLINHPIFIESWKCYKEHSTGIFDFEQNLKCFYPLLVIHIPNSD